MIMIFTRFENDETFKLKPAICSLSPILYGLERRIIKIEINSNFIADAQYKIKDSTSKSTQ